MRNPLLILSAFLAVAVARPGLLRVPKVYNAVITSNQNLSPSRAYPVIQPVIHRTAIGYVPPLYYTQLATSRFVDGTEAVRLQPEAEEASKTRGVETVPDPRYSTLAAGYPDLNKEAAKGNFERPGNPEPNEKQKSLILNTDRHRPQGNSAEANENPESLQEEGNGRKKKKQRKNEEPIPVLSFYPNYRSLYYDPYFYTYNGLNPQFLPGTYYVSYQPYSAALSLPGTAFTEQNGKPESPLVDYRPESTRKEPAKERAERIPDVPPPPLPTGLPRGSS